MEPPARLLIWLKAATWVSVAINPAPLLAEIVPELVMDAVAE
jgi:hypothetical protein